MANNVGSSQEPISANALNLTRGTSLAAVATTVGTVLSAALGAFKGEPVEIVIAAMAAITVGVVVAGFVVVTDMRVRSQQAIAASYLRYLRKQGRVPVPSHGNGHDAETFVEKAAGIKSAAG
jgi:hypothetical protein